MRLRRSKETLDYLYHVAIDSKPVIASAFTMYLIQYQHNKFIPILCMYICLKSFLLPHFANSSGSQSTLWSEERETHNDQFQNHIM